MAYDGDSQLLLRAALHRKALADARQRAVLARRLGLTDSEVLAVQHLARAGELTPGQLGALLQLSSGGTTGLIHRRIAPDTSAATPTRATNAAPWCVSRPRSPNGRRMRGRRSSTSSTGSPHPCREERMRSCGASLRAPPRPRNATPTVLSGRRRQRARRARRSPAGVVGMTAARQRALSRVSAASAEAAAPPGRTNGAGRPVRRHAFWAW